MSKFALTCLLLTAAYVYGAFAEIIQEPGALAAACKAGIGVFGTLFLIALMIGRKIKFDPVLR
ncbi:PA3371 family protein [Stutzerimonas stutzeri]|uniref:PA3371 family protein n=1 Tax=Stutzerimonas stutzeri TaxID=316 RepID=UPI003EDF528D